MGEVYLFQSKMNNFHKHGNLNEAFCIAAAIVLECGEAVNYMDDSYGECSGTVYECIEMIENIFDATDSTPLKTKILDWVYKQMLNDDFNSFMANSDLEELFFRTATALNLLDQAHQYIDGKINMYENYNGWSRDYNMERYMEEKIKLLKSEGRMAEIDHIIEASAHLAKLRQVQVDRALSDNDFGRAESLMIKGG